MTKPITPREAREQSAAYKLSRIPPEVIEAFNELLKEKLNGKVAQITQEEAVNRILQKAGIKICRKEIFDKHYLDIEPIFKKAGWSVYFDKAVAWGGDNYNSFWKFTISDNRDE